MAETLANGTTVPQGSDPIHGSGVQAMRNLGGSVDGQLGNRYTKAQADALLAGKAASSHTHPVSQVTGLQAALDAKVGSADPRLSDARTPLPHGHQIGDVDGLDAALDAAGGSASWAQVADKPTVFPPSAHTHAVADVTGLAARLAALEYKSGRRNITALLNPAPVSGNLYIERRGDTVWLHMDALVLTATGFAANLYSGVIASGFQATVPIEAPTSPRLVQSLDYPEANPDVDTNIRTYNQVLGFYRVRPGAVVRGMTSWPTNQAIPTTLPGSPA